MSARVDPEPAGVDYGEILRRADAISHCDRMRRWLRASLVANLLLGAAVVGMARYLSLR